MTLPPLLPTRLRRAMPSALRCLRGRGGVSAVEFALLLPLLIVLLLGAFDLGNAFQQSIRLEAAARAGAQAAFGNPSPGNMPKIVDLVRANLPASWTDVQISAQITACQCNDGTEASCNFSLNSTCSTPKVVRITVTRPFTYVGPTQYIVPNLSPLRGHVEVRLM